MIVYRLLFLSSCDLVDTLTCAGATVTGYTRDPESGTAKLGLCLDPGACAECPPPLDFATQADAAAFAHMTNGTKPDGSPRYCFAHVTFGITAVEIATA